MSFRNALYYPTIDIPEENWLMSAVLYWDNIQTIVPTAIKDPYKSRTTAILHDNGLLTPFEVNSDHRFVSELSATVLKYISEASNFIVSSDGQATHLHSDKLPREFREFSRIYPEKLPHEIRRLIERNIDDEGWFRASPEFGAFYMSLLANKICENRALALLTDSPVASNLTEQARLDNKIGFDAGWRDDFYMRNERTTLNLAQGLLTNLIIKGVKIAPTDKPEVLVKKIIKFKKEHKDELGNFRTNLTKLVKDIDKDASLEAVQEHVINIYNNEFLPSLNELQNGLERSKIKWFYDTLLQVSVITTTATAFLPALIGLSIPQALVGVAGLSLIAKKTVYNTDKAQKIADSPYSYLLSAQKELNKTVLNNIVT